MSQRKLKQQLIRLGEERPDLRGDIRPVLDEITGKTKQAGRRDVSSLAQHIDRAVQQGDESGAIDAMIDLISTLGWMLDDMGHSETGNKVRGATGDLMRLLREYK